MIGFKIMQIISKLIFPDKKSWGVKSEIAFHYTCGNNMNENNLATVLVIDYDMDLISPTGVQRRTYDHLKTLLIFQVRQQFFNALCSLLKVHPTRVTLGVWFILALGRLGSGHNSMIDDFHIQVVSLLPALLSPDSWLHCHVT